MSRKFVSFGTGKVLDSNGNGEVYTLDDNGGNYQRWIWGNDQSIINVATGFALDCNGDRIYTLAPNGGNYQKWVGTNNNGVRNVATGKLLDSNGAGEVYPLNDNGGDYQKWGN